MEAGDFGRSSASQTMTVDARECQRVLRALLDGPRNSLRLERGLIYDHCANCIFGELRKLGVGINTTVVEIGRNSVIPERLARYELTDDVRKAAAWRLLARS